MTIQNGVRDTTVERGVPCPRDSIRTLGYGRFDIHDYTGDIDTRHALEALDHEFEDLPRDPYALSLNRFRRYATALLLPWSRELEWLPDFEAEDGRTWTEYYQGSHNPEFSGLSRRFESLSARARANPLLERMIWTDFDLASWGSSDLARPLHVGVHLVKLLVRQAGELAVSSPNHLHQDGEPFTFVHLIRRENAVGGVNTIAAPECVGLLPEGLAAEGILDTFELSRPLESYAVCDRLVSHYVSPLTRGPGCRDAQRAVVLIDFTPMVPRI